MDDQADTRHTPAAVPTRSTPRTGARRASGEPRETASRRDTVAGPPAALAAAGLRPTRRLGRLGPLVWLAPFKFNFNAVLPKDWPSSANQTPTDLVGRSNAPNSNFLKIQLYRLISLLLT